MVQRLVFVINRRLANEVYYVFDDLLVKGREDIKVLSVISYYTTEAKLSFGLSEPDLRLGGPEGWELKQNCIYCHEITFLASRSPL